MFAIVRYAGQRRRAFVLDYLTRHGEIYVEALIDGFKVIKQIHASAIIKSNAA